MFALHTACIEFCFVVNINGVHFGIKSDEKRKETAKFGPLLVAMCYGWES